MSDYIDNNYMLVSVLPVNLIPFLEHKLTPVGSADGLLASQNSCLGHVIHPADAMLWHGLLGCCLCFEEPVVGSFIICGRCVTVCPTVGFAFCGNSQTMGDANTVTESF